MTVNDVHKLKPQIQWVFKMLKSQTQLIKIKYLLQLKNIEVAFFKT